MTKKYTVNERKEYLARWRESGLSGSQFCKENNIRPATFYGWIKSEKQKQNKSKPVFVKLPVFEVSKQNISEIIIEHGKWKIKLSTGFNSEDLKTIMEVLDSSHVS